MYVGPGSGQGQLPWMMYRLRDIRSGSCRAVPAAFYLGTRASGLKPFARQSLPAPRSGRRFASGRGRAVRRAKPTWRVRLDAASRVQHAPRPRVRRPRALRRAPVVRARSEEETSELQTLMRISDAVLCLEK